MKELTTGKEYKVLFYFALPILIGNLFQQFYNVADSVIVGRFLGKQNLAAVGFCFQINAILNAVSMGLSLGMGILISRYVGAKETEKIYAVIDTGFYFSMVCSVIFCFLGIFLTDFLIDVFQVPDDTVYYTAIYLKILFLGTIPTFLYSAITNILRGLGDSKTAVYCLIGAAILNIVLDIYFCQKWGIGGAAAATVLSQWFCCGASFCMLSKKYPLYGIHIKKPQLQMAVLKKSLFIGIPSMTQQLFKSIGFLTLQGMVNSFGSTCMAAYSVTSKIDSFAQLPALHIGQTLSNFTAQNRGAKKEERVKRGFFAALFMAWGVTITISLLVVPFSQFIIKFFIKDPSVIDIGVGYLRIVALFYCVDAAMQVLNGILLGYERPFVPMISTIVSLCLMQVPAAYVLSHTSLGYIGIWLATPFGWIGGVLIRWYYYKKLCQEKKMAK